MNDVCSKFFSEFSLAAAAAAAADGPGQAFVRQDSVRPLLSLIAATNHSEFRSYQIETSFNVVRISIWKTT